MKRAELLKFIDLYNLSGNVERVKIDADGKRLKTVFITENKTLYGSIVHENLDMDTGEYGIYDTARLKKMLSILDEDITATVEKLDSGKVVGITFADKHTESFVMLADMSVIPKAPAGVRQFAVDLEVNLTSDFIQRYIRAKNALADAESFSFVPNKKTNKVEMILGHGATGTNRIKLEVDLVPGKDTLPSVLSFNADYLKEILSKNSDAGTTKLSVASGGLAHVQFKAKSYEANYYLLKLSNV